MNEKIQWKNCIISGFVGVLLTLCYSHFFDVKPAIDRLERTSSNILSQEEAIQTSIKSIENIYVIKDKHGMNCKVGINSDLVGNQVSVFKDNQFGLESQDIIYISNPYSMFTPSAAFMVYTVNGSDRNSDADLFVSKAGLEQLNISPKDLKKGLFEMTIRFKDHAKQEHLMNETANKNE